MDLVLLAKAINHKMFNDYNWLRFHSHIRINGCLLVKLFKKLTNTPFVD